MRLDAPGVRVVDAETCDFALMPCYDTAAVLRAAFPDGWARYLGSAVARRLIAELGWSAGTSRTSRGPSRRKGG